MSKSLPDIPVKHVPVRKVVNFTKSLDVKVRAYIAYYTERHGLDPKQAPSESDTIAALVDSYLSRNRMFGRYLRAKAASQGAQNSASASK